MCKGRRGRGEAETEDGRLPIFSLPFVYSCKLPAAVLTDKMGDQPM